MACGEMRQVLRSIFFYPGPKVLQNLSHELNIAEIGHIFEDGIFSAEQGGSKEGKCGIFGPANLDFSA